MDRMYETRCCGFDGDDGAECSDCAYIGTYFDCDVYLADRGKTLMARQSSELTDVYTFTARNFYRLIEEDNKCHQSATVTVDTALTNVAFPDVEFRPDEILGADAEPTDIRDVFMSDPEPKAIIMACSQMFIKRIIEATQEDE